MSPSSPSHTPLRAVSVSLLALAGALAACGGGMPDVNGGQSKLMDKTFAGANKCNPRNHNRPFIIEWDATDMSSFQSHAASDVVFVRYQGCDLEVLEGCRDDSVKGAFGAYKPVEWTSGGLEAIDIADENELYAKLPLGAASLGGRVESGEKFHMEYYVSGTRNATRDHVYRGELSKIAACQGATHYVYGYNLGAFALASASKLHGEVNGSYFGFGAGGAKTTTSQAEKKGGDIGACKGDSAREVEDCKVPIRLTLRAIEDGSNPDVQASQAPDTDAAKNLAGRLEARSDAERAAEEHLKTADTKMNSRDGKGCLAELDQHDQLDPRPSGLSTSPQAWHAVTTRAQCLMLAGQCAAGKDLFRKFAMANWGAQSGPERVDQVAEATAATWCQGGSMTPRDQLLGALATMRDGWLVKKFSAAQCQSAYETMMGLRGRVTPTDDSDKQVADPVNASLMTAPGCFVHAGDCTSAFKTFGELARIHYPNDPAFRTSRPDLQWWNDDAKMRAQFDQSFAACKGK
jgi:hypothetical protein